jgi:hypothetical protein
MQENAVDRVKIAIAPVVNFKILSQFKTIPTLTKVAHLVTNH